MSVFKKLNTARVRFHGAQLKKTGNNTFSNYKYFELGDFLPAALKIFDEIGLCAVVSFGFDLAEMKIVDVDTGEATFITSPMSQAQLKACHPVQNLGAVQTYLRRYLWTAALEIVEHDAIDATAGAETDQPEPTKTTADPDRVFRAQVNLIQKASDMVALQAAFKIAADWGKHHPDFLEKLIAAKDVRKAQLEKAA